MSHPAGSLFVVGGAEDRTRAKLILDRFAETCGGADAHILLVASASGHPEKVLEEYEEAFRDLGVHDLTHTYQGHRSHLDDPALHEALERATGVYFTGGDQLKLGALLAATPFAARLRERYNDEGLHLGGTSAGASAMSELMIARGRARAMPRLSSVRFADGLGILPGVIIDQHFQERDRIGRLMAAVLRRPGTLGIGVDEDTAFILKDGTIDVIGAGTITIVDSAGLVGSNIPELRDHETIQFAGLTVHVLGPGWHYDLDDRTVAIPSSMKSLVRSGQLTPSQGGTA